MNAITQTNLPLPRDKPESETKESEATSAEPARRPTTLEGLERHLAELEAADDFEWSADNPSVVIPEQPRTAVYWNRAGQLVIRQERGPLEEDDSAVVFNPDSLKALITELRDQDAKSGDRF